MAQSRKRKHLDDPAVIAATSTKNIKSFGRVQKPCSTATSSKRQKTLHEKEQNMVASSMTVVKAHCTHGKRKRFVEDPAPAVQLHPISSEPCKKRIKPYAPPRGQSLPRTPTKTAVSLFSNLNLSPTRSLVFQPEEETNQVKSQGGRLEQANIAQYTITGLSDLKTLCHAFLSALSLFYAHNGSSSPANIASLLPMVTSHWKRRTCNLNDLRIIIALLNKKELAFVLQEFEISGIHLLRTHCHGDSYKHVSNFVDEVKLKLNFDEALENEWAAWQRTEQLSASDYTSFLANLSREAIGAGSNNTLPSRGKQRLSEIKAHPIAAKCAAQDTKSANIVPTEADQTVTNRKANLLERILEKQAYRAAHPAGPTKPQMERKAALQRIEDIARVLDLLAAGRARCSFGIQALTAQLQQSLRNPIAKEEALRCLELMANEITPGFVNVITSGNMTSIVVTRGGKVELSLLRKRIQRASSSV